MTDDTDLRRTSALCLTAFTAPAVMLCAGRPWPGVLAGCCAAALYYILYIWLQRELAEPGDLIGLSQKAYGAAGARIFLLPAALWMLLVLARTAAECPAAFPDGRTDRLAGGVLLALAAMAVWKKDVLKRAAAVLAPILGAGYAVLICIALPGLHPQWCAPAGSAAELPADIGTALLPSAALFLPKRENRTEIPFGSLLILAFAPAVFSVVTVGNLGPSVTALEKTPFYTLTKSLSLLSVIERFEPILSCTLYIGFFCMAGLLLDGIKNTLNFCIGTKENETVLPAAVLTYLLKNRTARLRAEIWGWGAILFWGILPALTLGIVAAKKIAKKVKKGVDKRDASC